MFSGASWEASYSRQVAALYSDHHRQVPLYIKCLDQGRLAALDRWLRYTVTTIDKFHVPVALQILCCIMYCNVVWIALW